MGSTPMLFTSASQRQSPMRPSNVEDVNRSLPAFMLSMHSETTRTLDLVCFPFPAPALLRKRLGPPQVSGERAVELCSLHLLLLSAEGVHICCTFLPSRFHMAVIVPGTDQVTSSGFVRVLHWAGGSFPKPHGNRRDSLNVCRALFKA